MLLIQPRVLKDPRGFFFESYREDAMSGAGIRERFVQENHSQSLRNVVRGLHYQLIHPQAKLCRVACGEVLDVALDIRVGSPTFGKWYGVVLSADNKLQLYIPSGFAHGFAVRSERADFLYRCSDYYAPDDDRGVLWNDAEIGIDWQTEHPVLSPRDQQHLPLSQVPRDLLPRYQP